MAKPYHADKPARNYHNVGELLDIIEAEELQMTVLLRNIIFDCLPDIEEKLSYNVPYYSRHSGLCFIWPGSVAWGKKTYDGVRFGFMKGYLLSDESHFLDKGKRKQIFWHDYKSLKEINAEELKAVIFEAAIVDEQYRKSKSKFRRI